MKAIYAYASTGLAALGGMLLVALSPTVRRFGVYARAAGVPSPCTLQTAHLAPAGRGVRPPVDTPERTDGRGCSSAPAGRTPRGIDRTAYGGNTRGTGVLVQTATAIQGRGSCGCRRVRVSARLGTRPRPLPLASMGS
jgi:hypothetical protein